MQALEVGGVVAAEEIGVNMEAAMDVDPHFLIFVLELHHAGGRREELQDGRHYRDADILQGVPDDGYADALTTALLMSKDGLDTGEGLI